MNRNVVVAILCVLVSASASAQRDFSKVEMKVTAVVGHIYMLDGAGGNIGVSAGPDGVLIVDDQYAPLADKIRAALKSVNQGPLKFVLNTHWHGDHVGGNESFGPEAPIIAHENVRKRMYAGSSDPENVVAPAPAKALPVITFNESMSVHFNGEEIRMIHYPGGHTDGDSVIYFTGSNVVHMGDDFFNGMFPFVDLSSGGSVDGLARNVASVLARIPEDASIIPGHGPLAKTADLRRFHRMLTETIQLVRNARKAGKSLDEIKAAGVPAEWESWGKGFIKTDFWLETIYTSQQQENTRLKH